MRRPRLQPMLLTPDKQTYCTSAQNDQTWLRTYYDCFPVELREALEVSPFKFCPLFIYHMACHLHDPPTLEDCLAVIAAYTGQVRTDNT